MWTYRLEVPEELGIPECYLRLRQRFKMMVIRCYSTGHSRVTTPNEDRYIWQLLPKEKDGDTASDLSRQLSSATGTRQFQGRPCTDA
ncbi:hypothetical protein TNCV_2857511 [Trichonephila clavipes]|nr:hypothetical protein TNCV_2857511 [Trichonephila clavipes]